MDADAKPQLIADDPGIARAGAVLAAAPWVALALELNATRGYRPKICLVQVDAAGELMAIDPLAFQGRRPDPVAAALGRITGTVIAHGGEYTLAALERELHWLPERLADTQEAAVLLGLPATGLRSLCADLLGVTLPPPLSHDWSQRPIAPAMVAHALGDVAHLGALHRVLARRITAADLEDEWAIASRPRPSRSFVTPDTPDPRRYRRLPGARGLPAEGLHLLGALVRWRDMKAKELDLPPGRLLTNAQLVDLAHVPERAVERLTAMRFHSRLVHADLEALRRTAALALATAGERTPPSDGGAPRAPKRGPPTPEVRARLQRLKAWRRDEADRRGVGLMAILPAAALEHLAWFPGTPLVEVPMLGRRRVERYARAITALL